MPFSLTSTSFPNQGTIPPRHTCEGAGTSPPLTWTDPPAGTKSLALVVDDPDAPDPAAPKTTWTHWVLYDIPPSARTLREGVRTDDLPDGTREGRNGWNRTGFSGPCPPVGKHRYIHKLYALDTVLPDLRLPTEAELERAMRGHVIGMAELVGTYEQGR